MREHEQNDKVCIYEGVSEMRALKLGALQNRSREGELLRFFGSLARGAPHSTRDAS